MLRRWREPKKRKSHSNTSLPGADEALFHALRRGAGLSSAPGQAAQTGFPGAEHILADPSLAFSMDNPEGKLFLGLVGGAMGESGGYRHAAGGHLIGIADDRHVMIVAGSRAGKGRSILMAALATYPSSIIYIDPKLDGATESAVLRDQFFGQKVHVIDPFMIAGPSCDPYIASYNPLAHPLGNDPDDLIDLAALIADGLIVTSASKDPHWDEAARQYCEAVVLHILTCDTYADDRNLGTLYDLVMKHAESPDGENPSRLESEMMDNHAAGDAVAAGATAFYDKEDRERSAVLSNLRRHLHFLSYPKVRAALRDGPVDPRTLHDTPTTVYLGLPATKLKSCAGLPRLFLNLTLAAFEANTARRDFQHQAGRLPTLIIVDEAYALGRSEMLEVSMGLAAGFGVKLCPVFQDLNQAKTLYPNTWQTFLGNCGTQVFFGNADNFTLEYLEKRLGQTRVFTPSHSDPAYDAAVQGGATGSSFGMAMHPLMSAAEIARTFDRDDPYHRMLVLSARHGPMVIQRAMYDQHPTLKERFNEAS